MVKLSLISLALRLIISVLCFSVTSVNSHPLFLKTIAKASSASSGLNSLNSYSGQSNRNSNNGNSAVNSNPLQGLINTKINIVGRALIQIGEAFERYGSGENSGSSPKAINNVNGIGSTTEAIATFDIDANLDARFNADDDIKPNGSKTNGKKVKITTTTTEAPSVVEEDDAISSDTDMDEKEIIADKDNEDGGEEKDTKDEADEKDTKDETDEKDDAESNKNEDEALKIDLFKLNDGSSDNGFKLDDSSDMKQVSADFSSDDDLEKAVTDDEKNNEESESSDNKKVENLDTNKGPDDEGELSENSDNVNFIANANAGKNNSKEGSGNQASGYQYEESQAKSPNGYNYEGGKGAPPREYKYTAPNIKSPGYQYSRPASLLPGYTYQNVPNTQPGYNNQPNQGLNFNPPGYNYQPNIQRNGYEQPIITTTSTLGYNYVQPGSPSSGIKMNRIRSTTSGYHYPKPQTAISGTFTDGSPVQPSIYYNNRQPSSNNDFNYRSSGLSNQSPSNALNFQNSGMVNPSQIVNNVKLNNPFNYQTTSNVNPGGYTYQSAVPAFNPAPNFNTNIGNLNSNLGTTSIIPSSFGNTYNINAPIINSRPTGVTASNSANRIASSNINQRPTSVVQNQQSVQYSQSPNINFNQFNVVGNTNRPSYSGNLNQRSSPQSSGFLSNSVLGASISTLISNSNRPTSTIISSTPTVNQNSANSSPGRSSFGGNIRPTSNIINSSPNVNQNSGILSPASARPSFAGNKNIGQDLVQRQGNAGVNVASVNNNKKVVKPEIDHFAIIPSLVNPSSNKNVNSNVKTQQSQSQQGGSFTTAPNFNFNLNSAFTNSISGNNNNNNQRPVQQQQSLRINTSPNLASNSNSFSNTAGNNLNFQRPNSGQQINLNINRNPSNGFLSSGIQNQNGRLSSSDSTLRLTGTGYNAGNGVGISQGQTNQYQQNSGTTQGNTNVDDEVTNSSINTLSALKNLSESEYYENGVRKLQYPNDTDEDVAFRAASDSLLVGDIRRYKKQSNPIQSNQHNQYLIQSN